MANFVSIALIVLGFANIYYQVNCIGTILHHPQSRLVPVGVEVTFICIFRYGLNPHWVIDGEALLYRNSIERAAAEKGYIIQVQETANHNYSLSLMFNTTMEKNGTTIFCSSYNTHSDIAVLLVMSETPLVTNPFVMNPNKSSVLLKWSPPFLWPGRVIDHYCVSIADAAESDKMFYRVNSTFSDAVVSFLKTSNNPTEIRHCNEIQFGISAVTDDGTELETFTVVGGYLPNVVNITLDDINVTVLFEQDGSPAIVIVYIKLPQTICSYQYVNYSICIEGSGKVLQHGSYQQYGSNPIRKMIASSLENDKHYTLMAIFNTQAGVFYSQQYSFSTMFLLGDQTNCSINKTETFVYKITTGIFAGVTMAILLLILIVSLGAICHRKLKRTVVLPNATNRMFNAMTHNPIYDGPVYDSIVQSQFDTLPTNLKASDASAAGQIMLPLSGPSCSDQVSDNSGSVSPKRYIKQSRQAKLLLPNTSCEKSSAPTADIVNASESTASSQSVTDSVVAANNQAFDIPPSYSECTSNDGSLRINETPKSKAVKQTVSAELRSNDDEDSKYMYTVMEPIGAIPFSLEKQELN